MNLSKRTTIVTMLFLLLVIELIVCLQYVGPAVITSASADAAAGRGELLFSAARALEIHKRIFDGSPHPAGSVANDEVRERLVKLLREQGWIVEIQSSETQVGEPILLHNVIAHRPEQAQLSLQPLVLASHYDSCRFGPGAGDAGSCVAAITEAARLLTIQSDRLKRPVWLLFTDGEENGLLGALEVIAEHPLSRQRPLVLNFDARGSSGPVVMYETHPGNMTAVSAWINQLARPRITGSIFTSVYRSMPNGTDFSVFQEAGWQGFNFAIIDGAHRYHQPDDTIANLDPRSVQHFGEQALKMSSLIASSERDLDVTTEDAVFFDILGLYVFHYPVWWCKFIRVALLFAAMQMYGRKALRKIVLRQSFQVWLTMLMILIGSIAVGWTISACIRGTILLPRSFVWYGHILSFTMWCLAMLMSLGIAHWLLRRIEQRLVWNAFWLGQATTCLVVSIWAPEFSHIFSIPGALAIILTLTIPSISLRTVLATVASGVMLIPTQHLLAIALGPAAGLVLFPAFILIAMPMLPAMGRAAANDESQDIIRDHNPLLTEQSDASAVSNVPA